MGEYADMEIDSGIDGWNYSDYIPSTAFMPRGKYYKVSKFIKEKETEKAYCVVFIMDNMDTPEVYMPKSRVKRKGNNLWIPYWLVKIKTKEICQKIDGARNGL